MLMTILRPLMATPRTVLPVAAGIVVMFFSVSVFAADRPDSFADQVEQLSPAVVNISTTTIINDGPPVDMPQFPPDHHLRSSSKILVIMIANGVHHRLDQASSLMKPGLL